MKGADNKSRTAPSRLERFGLRFLQFSPLVVLALAAAVWFAVPGTVRPAMLAPTPTPRFESPVPSENDRHLAAVNTFRERGLLGPDTTTNWMWATHMARQQLDSAVRRSWVNLTAERDALFTNSGVRPSPVPADAPAFAPLAEFEQRTGSRVIMFIAPGAEAPQVVLTSTAEHELLTLAERSELAANGTLETFRQEMLTASTSPLPLEVGLSMGWGRDSAERAVRSTVRSIGEDIWEFYLLATPERMSEAERSAPLPGVPEADPSSPEGAAEILSFARTQQLDLYVIGPVDGAPVVLRTPRGVDGAALLEHAWPSRAGLGDPWYGEEPFSLDEAERATVRARWGMLSMLPRDSVGWPTNPPGGPQAICALALFPNHPEWATVVRDPAIPVWSKVRIALAANLRFLFGSLALLGALSLVASPAAFAWERRRRTERELTEQRERVLRESHERVTARLTGLAARIETEAAAASRDARRHLHTAARDIDETVADLRHILGDDGPRRPGGHDER
jgi:hypothetical protein